MSSKSACVWFLAISSCAFFAACNFEDTRRDKCENDADCNGGECERGYCIRSSGGSRLDAGDTRDASVPTGMMMNPSTRADGGQSRTDAGSMMRADAGPSQPQDSGMMSQPDGGMTTAPCRTGETRACVLPGDMAERCRTGNQTCENGSYGACVATETPAPEQCNGIDDDCDGKTDEGANEICYPEGEDGCALATNQAPNCQGICATGVRMCRDGKLEACTGAITPQWEMCTTSGAAADENCDGRIDEICSCAAGEVRSCYTAASGTINVGICRAGTQACTNGMLGPCTGSVVPRAETCMNETTDDDCNGVVDDIPNRGMPCTVASNMGVCRIGVFQCQGDRPELTCVTPMPGPETCNQFDDDCDGQTDETTNLQTDNANCGACGNACAMGQTCCAGVCVDTNTDAMNCGACGAPACADGSSCCGGTCADTTHDGANCGMCGRTCASGETCCGGTCVDTQADVMHCGGCGTPCTTGTQPGCCDGMCVDLLSQDNCGRCGNRCGLLDGVTCTCSATPEGTVCFAPVLGVCL